MKKKLSKLENKINIKFHNKKLLLKALTHKSYLNEHPKAGQNHNERLEFLGDAVLEFITTKHLYDKFQKEAEGKLTALRASLVNTKSLAKTAKKLDLDKYILLSKGERKTKTQKTILANVMEALIGAIFLDQNIKKAKQFISEFIFHKIEKIIKSKAYKNAKGQLQEITQSKIKSTPTYKLISKKGPEHNKIFKVGVFINNKKIATGQDKSKQKAEIDAAQNALEKID